MTWAYSFGTCRRCGEMDDHNVLVRYGARHYMHFHCFLESGKPLSKLPRHDIGRMPHRLLAKAGRLDEARQAIAEKIWMRSI